MREITNIGIRPLGRGAEPSAAIAEENARLAAYAAELHAACKLSCQLARAKAYRTAIAKHMPGTVGTMVELGLDF